MNNIMKISSVNHESNDAGEEYGVVMTSVKIIGDLLKKKDFDYCVAAYDGVGSGVLRWKIYEDYKANRGKNYILHDPDTSDYMKKMYLFERQVIEHSKNKHGGDKRKSIEDEEASFERQRLILQNILEELCVRQYEFENVEGDDIIAHYVLNKKGNEKIVVVSTDKDLTQLISEDVIVYSPKLRDFITKDNSVQKIGITHENVALEKILCGDQSDNIKGIKGMGSGTLMKLFPEIKSEKVDLGHIVGKAEKLLEDRKSNKQKPLKVLENVVNSITDGKQGKDIYDINKRLIDLSNPMLTESAKQELDDLLYAPMDVSDRSVQNVYRIISENRMYKLTDESRFGNLFSPFYRIMMVERRRFEAFSSAK